MNCIVDYSQTATLNVNAQRLITYVYNIFKEQNEIEKSVISVDSSK